MQLMFSDVLDQPGVVLLYAVLETFAHSSLQLLLLFDKHIEEAVSYLPTFIFPRVPSKNGASCLNDQKYEQQATSKKYEKCNKVHLGLTQIPGSA